MIAPIPLALEKLERCYGTLAQDVLRADIAKDDSVWMQVGEGKEQRWFRSASALEQRTPQDDKRIPLCGTLEFDDPKLQLLAWRPGRRIALRLDGEGSFEVLKGLRSKKLSATHGAYELVHRSLICADDFIVPRAQMVPEWNALRMNGLELEPIPISAESASTFHRVGLALACFQDRIPTSDLPQRGFRQELSVLGDLVERHMRGLGCLPEDWDAQRRRLHAVRFHDQHRPVASHRDLHDGQLLSNAERVALLDFDLLACASPLLDLGNLCAHFQLRVLQGRTTNAEAARLCEAALLEGYGLKHTPEIHSELLAYKASTYLRLALVYSMRPKWQALAPALIQLAKGCIDESDED